ncbi:hypothetical protein JKF63_00399 [Porcisia hertigi]|uniref:Uncharacterized protein n=1 Tax=Porcisia hertigi TaxID=2761500 RepID=A0A836KX41_9TRYP|nr:hypothetical protein JKF63_00399 [Porcisia hertigi]
MGRRSFMERYFAQCQAHRTPPRAEFLASLRDGVMDINLAEIPLADIRLFAHALLDASPEIGTGRSSAVVSHSSSKQRGRRDVASESDVSSQRAAASAVSSTPLVKLHISYNTTFATAHHQRTTASTSSMLTQNEPALRCLPVALAQAVKENVTTLKSFAWCHMPLTVSAAPARVLLRQHGGGGARALPSLTDVLPLCHSLTNLRLDGVPLSRAQFMQLTLLSSKSPLASTEGGVAWPALEEASFVGCGLTDAYQRGLVSLIRAAVTSASSSTWQRSLRGGLASPDNRPLPQPPAGTTSPGQSATRGLKRLNASQNPLGDGTARAIASAIAGSALRYLNLSSTSISWEGGSLLFSPSVLEETAIELVDMSNTGVSEVFTKTGAAAEARMLTESSAAAGFRVVARGMGQLLILRESAHSPQQSWRIHTNPSPAPQPPPEHAPEWPRVEPATPTPVSVNERKTGNVAPPALAPQSSSFNTQNDHVTPQPGHSSACVPVPAMSSYGPWCPMFPSWHAAQGINSPVCSAAAAATGDSGVVPREGYVLVPAPFPMFAPMAMPYTVATAAPPRGGAVAEVSEAFSKRGVPSPTPRDSLDVALLTREPLSPTPEGGNHDESRHESLTGGLVHPLDSASAVTQTAADAVSASDDLVHRVSEAAGDRKFLLGLITRLEEYEIGITERLEAQYQRTTTQLTLLEKDMRFRLQQLADADRKERAVAAERQAALLEALAALRTEQATAPAEGMMEAMLPQLMHLIEMGMEKVQEALGAGDAGSVKDSGRGGRKASRLPRSTDVATHADAAPITDRDLVRAASERLKDLGW